LRCDRHHRNARALAVEQTVDKVQVAGAATSGADREAVSYVGVGAGGEGGDLLVPHVQPFDPVAPPNGVGEAVQAVADDALDALHACRGENPNHLIGDGLGHRVLHGSTGVGSTTIDETRR
jgi:hypothetical protein